MAGFTKHEQIVETIRQRVNSGQYTASQRIPTDEMFAEEFGASRPTVAKAVGELVKSGMLVRIAGSGTYVQQYYSCSRRFGLLIPGLGETEILDPICAQMARSAQINRHMLLWGANPSRAKSSSNDVIDAIKLLAKQYIEDRVDGVFFAPVEYVENQLEINKEIVSMFQTERIPVVLLDRDYVPYPKRSECDLIGIDNRRVGHTITQHLIDQGAKRLAFVAKEYSAATIDARFAGFTEAHFKSGLAVSPEQFVRWKLGLTKQLADTIETLKPEGFVCGNDATAAQLLQSLQELGVRVPDDVLVAGVDDVRFAELLRVPLTTVHQPCEAIGHAGFQAMLDRIEYPEAPAKEILLGCDIVVRKSTQNERSDSNGCA